MSTKNSLEKVELENARKALDDIETEKEFIIEKQLFPPPLTFAVFQ